MNKTTTTELWDKHFDNMSDIKEPDVRSVLKKMKKLAKTYDDYIALASAFGVDSQKYKEDTKIALNKAYELAQKSDDVLFVAECSKGMAYDENLVERCYEKAYELGLKEIEEEYSNSTEWLINYADEISAKLKREVTKILKGDKDEEI